MESRGNPDFSRSPRKDVCNMFQGGFIRGLSLPRQVSTTIRLPSDSSTRAWILIRTRPPGSAKCGCNQVSRWIFSGVASGRTKVAFEMVSISTIRLIFTLPICHRFIFSLPFLVAGFIWLAHHGVETAGGRVTLKVEIGRWDIVVEQYVVAVTGVRSLKGRVMTLQIPPVGKCGAGRVLRSDVRNLSDY